MPDDAQSESSAETVIDGDDDSEATADGDGGDDLDGGNGLTDTEDNSMPSICLPMTRTTGYERTEQLDTLLPLKQAAGGDQLLWYDYLSGSSSVTSSLRLQQPEDLVSMNSLGDQPSEDHPAFAPLRQLVKDLRIEAELLHDLDLPATATCLDRVARYYSEFPALCIARDKPVSLNSSIPNVLSP